MSNETTQKITFSGTATVKRVDPFTSKKGTSIPTLVVEIPGQYPQLVPLKAFREMAEEVEALKPGQLVNVSGHLGGRDFNGRVYGDIVLDAIEVVGGKQAEEQPSSPPASDDDVPF